MGHFTLGHLDGGLGHLDGGGDSVEAAFGAI